jgi:hypothetical protein
MRSISRRPAQADPFPPADGHVVRAYATENLDRGIGVCALAQDYFVTTNWVNDAMAQGGTQDRFRGMFLTERA